MLDAGYSINAILHVQSFLSFIEYRESYIENREVSSIDHRESSIPTQFRLPEIWHDTFHKMPIEVKEPLPFFCILEKITDKTYLTVFHFQYSDSLVFVGFFTSVHPAVGPVHSGLIAMVNHS